MLFRSDIIAPSLALGLAFGRMGCFFNGCCYGGTSHLPWAFIWPVDSIPWNAGLHGPIHPAQIYGVINALLLFGLLNLLMRHKRLHGQIMGAFFGLYAVSRFLLEWLRVDEAKAYGGGLELTVSQMVSLVAIVPIIVYFLILPRLKLARIDEPVVADEQKSAKGKRAVVKQKLG